MRVKHFKSAEVFRGWLEANHSQCTKLWVGFYRKASGKGGITYPEAVDEALCYGWIDGVRKKVSDTAYTLRFSPRTVKSVWSLVNTRRAKELIRQGRMTPAGLRAFKARDPRKSKEVYSSSARRQPLSRPFEDRFRKQAKAWSFFTAQAPGYRAILSGWIMNAKKEETRWRRLERVIMASAQGVKLGW